MRRHYFDSPDDGDDRKCIICGGYIGFTHECSKAALAAIDSPHRRGSVEKMLASPPLFVRLASGFDLMNSDGDDPADTDWDDNEPSTEDG